MTYSRSGVSDIMKRTGAGDGGSGQKQRTEAVESLGKRQSYNAIDAARMIGACVTLGAHAWYVGNPNLRGLSASLCFVLFEYMGRVVVPFFIMTAAFFHYRKTAPDHFSLQYTLQSLKHYLRLYIIWTLIYLPLAVRDFFKHPKGVRHAVIAYFRNIIFTGDNLHLWFLTTLIFALFLVSFLLSRGVKPVRILGISFFFYLIGMFGQAWFGFLRPLREHAPLVWKALRASRLIIVTTRNGLFYGFFFVAMGMCFAYYGVRISRKAAAIGFILSYLAMGVEVMIFERLGSFREHDMTISLIPASFFLFSFLLRTDLPDAPLYKSLRKISALTYFMHMWMINIIAAVTEAAGIPVKQSFLLAVLALAGCIASSCLIIRLSEQESFRWLKALY